MTSYKLFEAPGKKHDAIIFLVSVSDTNLVSSKNV